MRTSIFLLLFTITSNLSAQVTNFLHGIVRQNYYSTVTDPFDSTITYQQFDSATIRLGYLNPVNGFVNNTGAATYSQAVNLTGAALNPYNNTYIFIGGAGINTFDLSTGNIINQAPLNNPIAASYFDNFRFNNSDSSMYGPARRNVYDPVTMTTIGELYLAKANTLTGLITQISPNSVGYGYALAGSAIDPYQMVYYYSTGANLVGLDIYNGSIYSSVPITVTDGIAFDNFTYSCADTALYGLIRQNYFGYIINPFFPFDSIQVLDSATIKLGKIDPNSGIVTTISPSSLMQGGYSLNGGSAIDPNTMTYYFSTGYNIVGVSLLTGLLTSNSLYTFASGEYFDLMRNTENCISSFAIRLDPTITGIDDVDDLRDIIIYPNPVADNLILNNSEKIKSIMITGIDGKIVYQDQNNTNTANINVASLKPGMYYVQLINGKNQIFVKKIIKE